MSEHAKEVLGSIKGWFIWNRRYGLRGTFRILKVKPNGLVVRRIRINEEKERFIEFPEVRLTLSFGSWLDDPSTVDIRLEINEEFVEKYSWLFPESNSTWAEGSLSPQIPR